ncbi:uncharacterized protein [Chironomus tepperi]|uniref:uncharacterized protein n=1 Tax=Chironomus tepperi TaxID=113505 RepID=UPI00391F2C9C
MSTIKSFLSILFISQTIHARSFNPCELENELSNNYNITADESRDLTCVAQKYSQLTTNIINNGSKTVYYGIFQIGQKWCGTDGPGGKCNIKCEDLVDDDITDDVKCAQKIFQKLGKKAWKLNKNPGCKKEFNYLDENCHKNANIDDTFQVQPDYCEFARKLMSLYDILSKIDATIWSCISEYSKTGYSNLQIEEENRHDDEESCVKARDVECAIKNNKQMGIRSFTNWPAYEQYCKNVTESTCFKDTNSVNRSDIIEQIKNVQYAETSMKPKIFTTSTEVSVFIEDANGNLTQYNDVITENPKESQQTTEFLSDTLEKPSYDDKPTIEGHSKVRIMSADKEIVEIPERLETTSKSLDEIMLINSSLAKSTAESISAELSHTKHTTEMNYYETIDKCALAKSMYESGRIPQNLISTFICIAEHESGLNVSFIDSDGQQSRYGLFQIDNQIYCTSNGNVNQCNVLCTHLVDDQFDNDFECVRHIFKKEGLNYWPSYEKSCKNINSNSMDYCFEQFTSQRPSTSLNSETEYHSTEGTSEATLNDLTRMEMTTLINVKESAPNDVSLDFCEFSYQLKVNLSIEIWEDLVHYVCIADQISHLTPRLLNDDRFGIFSLRDNTCGKYEAGGSCAILCSSLLNDDLIDDAECMIKVYKEHGLAEWNINKDSCKSYTPKILRCIDEGKFSIPSDDDNDDAVDHSVRTDSKDGEIQKHVENDLEMTLSRANIGVETQESVDDINKLDQTTLPTAEATSFTEDTTIESEILTVTKDNIQKEEEAISLTEVSTAKSEVPPVTKDHIQKDEETTEVASFADNTTVESEVPSVAKDHIQKEEETTETTSISEDTTIESEVSTVTKDHIQKEEEATSLTEDTTTESEIPTVTKDNIRKEEDLEIEDQNTTEPQKSSESTERYFKNEEPTAAMKSLLDIDTSEELEPETTTFEPENSSESTERNFEDDGPVVAIMKILLGIDTSKELKSESTTFEPQNDETTTMKFDDQDENETDAILEFNLLTTTTKSLLDVEIMDNELASQVDTTETTIKVDTSSQENNLTSQKDTTESTVKIDEATQENFKNLDNDDESDGVTQENLTTLDKNSKSSEIEGVDDTEQTTISATVSEETTFENDPSDLEKNQTEKDNSIENEVELLKSIQKVEDNEVTTEPATNEDETTESRKNQETEDLIKSNKEVEDHKIITEPATHDDETTQSLRHQEVEDLIKRSHEVESHEVSTEPATNEDETTQSQKNLEVEDQTNVQNNTSQSQRNQAAEDQIKIESDTTKSEEDQTTENYNNIENETKKLKSSQSTEIYDVVDETTVPVVSKTRIFSENDEKFIKEETTSHIPLNFDDKTEILEPEILSSENFLENTEKSPEEEETTTNVLNIEPISIESALNQSDSLKENTERSIEQESTTKIDKTSENEEQLYLKSTTISSLTSSISIVTDPFEEFTKQLSEDSTEHTTESDEQDEIKLEENTVSTAILDLESDSTVTTEESIPTPTTEGLYYTSIREIIEEYKKSNIKNPDNVQSKRYQNYSDEHTTLDAILDDDYENEYDDSSEYQDKSIESLNQNTTLPVTSSPIQYLQFQRMEKCELARHMNMSGFAENLIPTLICIAEHESELNPHAFRISRSNIKYGLFQIDDDIYCNTEQKINECDIPCALLTDNQFDNDFECVRHIYKKEGFNYWPTYERMCKNVSSDALDYCYEEVTTSHRPESAGNDELDKSQPLTSEIPQIEDIPVTTDSSNFNLEPLSTDNESKSIIRTFDVCELAHELHSLNISIDDIPQYLCIADLKSHLKISIPNENEQNYGLFFINAEFCGQRASDGLCSMTCSELWDSKISDDVNCVYNIIQTNGTDKWNLNSEACQIYVNKTWECFDKTLEFQPKIDVDDVQRNASDLRHDVIAEMTDMKSDMTDKNDEDLNLRSSNSDIESDEITTVTEKALPVELTTSKIIQILTSTASTDSTTDNLSKTTDKQTRRVPLVSINLPRDALTDQNLSNQVNTLIKNFTFYDVLPKNGSIIFNIFNFNIYGEDHDIKFNVNRGTEVNDSADDYA